MRFCLLDRICSLEPDAELTAIKNVSLSEEYLADHFPEFPVLPGVFMLEAATQAAAWLIRLTEDFAHSMIVLQEARSVKFTDFVSPSHSLVMKVEQLKRDGREVSMKFEGQVDGRACVSGRLTLECFNLAEQDPDLADLDRRIINQQRTMATILTRGASPVGVDA
ncbi:MAG: beta-hydroxyacyl-ACP dehydratase [Planctomycetota bacterium]|nr:MAG: beta-hydroxyacyl-ACP dehydratase [Planctomycetota bacterium]